MTLILNVNCVLTCHMHVLLAPLSFIIRALKWTCNSVPAGCVEILHFVVFCPWKDVFVTKLYF